MAKGSGFGKEGIHEVRSRTLRRPIVSLRDGACDPLREPNTP